MPICHRYYWRGKWCKIKNKEIFLEYRDLKLPEYLNWDITPYAYTSIENYKFCNINSFDIINLHKYGSKELFEYFHHKPNIMTVIQYGNLKLLKENNNIEFTLYMLRYALIYQQINIIDYIMCNISKHLPCICGNFRHQTNIECLYYEIKTFIYSRAFPEHMFKLLVHFDHIIENKYTIFVNCIYKNDLHMIDFCIKNNYPCATIIYFKAMSVEILDMLMKYKLEYFDRTFLIDAIHHNEQREEFLDKIITKFPINLFTIVDKKNRAALRSIIRMT